MAERKKWRRCEEDTEKTASVDNDKDGARFIKFTPCGVTSYHREDIRHRYCAYCNVYVVEPT